MIPRTVESATELRVVERPSKTYRLDLERGRVIGYCDGLEAIEQTIYLILSVERYRWLIHSWDYGHELAGLFGKPISFVQPEIERLVGEALLQDDRIISVGDFSFAHGERKGALLVTFQVETKLGDIQISNWEVAV